MSRLRRVAVGCNKGWHDHTWQDADTPSPTIRATNPGTMRDERTYGYLLFEVIP